MFDLENKGESDGAQHPQLCHSMANIKIYKSHSTHFNVSSHRFDITFQTFHIEILSNDHVQHSQFCHSMANINLYKCHNGQFCASSYLFSHINILNFWSRSWKRKTELTPFDYRLSKQFGGVGVKKIFCLSFIVCSVNVHTFAENVVLWLFILKL